MKAHIVADQTGDLGLFGSATVSEKTFQALLKAGFEVESIVDRRGWGAALEYLALLGHKSMGSRYCWLRRLTLAANHSKILDAYRGALLRINNPKKKHKNDFHAQKNKDASQVGFRIKQTARKSTTICTGSS